MSDVSDILARYRAPAAAPPNPDEPSALSPVSGILAKYRAPAAPAAEDFSGLATKLPPADEAKYQRWKATLPPRLQYEGDYDLRGFYKKNPAFSVDTPGQHMTDEFKLPNHETFSNESRYYGDKTKHLGGKWQDGPNGSSIFQPNDPSFKRRIEEDANGNRVEQAKPSKVESFAQGAISGGTLSFADEVQAALDTAVSKIPGVRSAAEASRSLVGKALPASAHLPVDNPDLTYQQRRDFLRQKGHEAEVANPKAYLAGELVGGAAPALAVPGVAGAKTVGQFAKAGAKAGAILGTAGGLGASDADLTHGDVAEALRDTLVGGAAGAVGGAVIGGAAAAGGKVIAAGAGKARKALNERFGRVFGSEVLGASKPKDVQAWGNILDRELDPVKHRGVTQTAEQFLVTPEMRAVEQAAHAKKTDQAEALVKEAFAKREPARVADYERIDAEHGQFEVGKGLDAIERDARRAANGPKKDGLIEKELQIARKNWVDDYSSIPADVLQRRIGQRAGMEGADTATSAALDALGKELPTSGLVTRTEIQKALEKTGEHAEVGRWLDKEVLDPQTGLLTWDPKATIPAIEMRSVVTSAQDKANTALGMLNATPNWQKSNAVKKAVNRALDDYLEQAAASSKGLRRTVTDIRQRDIELSVLAAARDGLRSTATKENVAEFKPLRQLGNLVNHGGTALLGAEEASHLADAKENVEGGHPVRGAVNLARGVFGLGLLGRAAVNRASRGQLLDTLLRAAEGGNPRAQALLAKYGGALGAEAAGGR